MIIKAFYSIKIQIQNRVKDRGLNTLKNTVYNVSKGKDCGLN